MTRSHKSAGRAKPVAQAKPVVHRPRRAAGTTAPDKEQAARELSRARNDADPSRSEKTLSKTAMAEPDSARPGAVIARRAADRLRAGHLWVYASDIQEIVSPTTEETLLAVADNRGVFLGTALFSPSSQIALRLVSRDALDHAAWLKLIEARFSSAIARRKPMLDRANDACRLCFSEADGLPGLVADKYGPLIVVQFLAKGLLAPGVAETCVRVLRKELKPVAHLRAPRSAHPRARGASCAGHRAFVECRSCAARREYTISSQWPHLSLRRECRPEDRRLPRPAHELRRRAGVGCGASEPPGRALDVCCYQGGFALHLAQVCRQVTGIDASRASLEMAERNLAANRSHIKADVDWIEADAFEILRDWSGAGEKFDTIVLDPPAFAKSKRAVEGALRGYKELNLRALKMIRPGGLLVTCSCSHHVGWADFEAAIASAAADAERRVRLLERRGAAPDHPVVLNLPETEYLKCLVLEVE